MKQVPIVYLAGGMRVEWRMAVKARVRNCIFLDPTEHNLNDEQSYTAWDLTAVDAADIIFAYAEASNPSCIGLAFELGWAAKAEKSIVYIEPDDHPKTQYLGMLRVASSVRVKTLDDGISMLDAAISCFPHRLTFIGSNPQ